MLIATELIPWVIVINNELGMREIMNTSEVLSSLKKSIKTILEECGITGRRLFYPGIGIGSFVIYSLPRVNNQLDVSLGQNLKKLNSMLMGIRARSATIHICNYLLRHKEGREVKVLDVGCGQLTYSQIFDCCGAKVTAVDFFPGKQVDNIDVISGNFMEVEFSEKYDVIFCSHVIEHQLNVNLFLIKLISLARDGGLVCITAPDAHRHLEGGHLTLWTPGLLAYNIVMCGYDLSKSNLIKDGKQFTIIFTVHKIDLPSLSFDTGDVRRLSQYFPPGYNELTDGWRSW